jgi:hypothetical protein
LISRRSVPGQVLLLVGTLGFYGIFWFYITAKEMHEHQDENITPAGNWTLLGILPIVSIYAYWQYSQYLGRLNGNKYPALLLTIIMLLPPMGLVIFVSPIGLAIIQRELNRIVAGSETASDAAGD